MLHCIACNCAVPRLLVAMHDTWQNAHSKPACACSASTDCAGWEMVAEANNS